MLLNKPGVREGLKKEKNILGINKNATQVIITYGKQQQQYKRHAHSNQSLYQGQERY